MFRNFWQQKLPCLKSWANRLEHRNSSYDLRIESQSISNGSRGERFVLSAYRNAEANLDQLAVVRIHIALSKQLWRRPNMTAVIVAS